MELILPFILEYPNIWVYDFPLNVICGVSILIGASIQGLLLIEKKKWFLLPLILLLLCAACEGLYLSVGTFEALLFVFVGVPAYFALFASLAVSLFAVIWTKVRHSKS